MDNVYILKCGDWYKIGIAVDVSNRLRSLQSGNPIELILYKSYPVDNTRAREIFLHNTFLDKRGVSEWFKLDQGDLEYIDKFCNAPFDANKSEVQHSPDAKYTSAAKMHRYYTELRSR